MRFEKPTFNFFDSSCQGILHGLSVRGHPILPDRDFLFHEGITALTGEPEYFIPHIFNILVLLLRRIKPITSGASFLKRGRTLVAEKYDVRDSFITFGDNYIMDSANVKPLLGYYDEFLVFDCIPESRPGILMIENVENGLSARRRGLVIPGLKKRFPKSQIILSSQCSSILDESDSVVAISGGVK